MVESVGLRLLRKQDVAAPGSPSVTAIQVSESGSTEDPLGGVDPSAKRSASRDAERPKLTFHAVEE